jgi:hypothetical protein
MSSASAQEKWKLKKEEAGIKVFTRDIPQSSVVAYKITTEVHAPLESVFDQVVDFHENKKYLKTVKHIHVLERHSGDYILVHLVFDMPWPFDDRDIVNKMIIHQEEDLITLNSTPAKDILEPSENTVRLKEFHETWKLKKMDDGKTSLHLEGHADPNVIFPGWIINLFVVEEPYSLIEGIRKEAEKH